ncbi:MAG: glycosyltransferase family A protein, partial [Verrucomicrobia bacterium]|nr:glycosyltransferase family A protein [Verrucomicrobiota bacterium]
MLRRNHKSQWSGVGILYNFAFCPLPMIAVIGPRAWVIPVGTNIACLLMPERKAMMETPRVNSQNDISIIIPTIATSGRAASLGRAIRSVTDDQDVPAIPIVVANGDQFDPALLDALKANTGVRFFYLEKGDLPMARRLGVKCVNTKYFGFLDDDDEYKPNALKRRLEPFERDTAVDAVISNGYKTSISDNTLCFTDLDTITRDPLRALLTRNWLASCGGLFR